MVHSGPRLTVQVPHAMFLTLVFPSTEPVWPVVYYVLEVQGAPCDLLQ